MPLVRGLLLLFLTILFVIISDKRVTAIYNEDCIKFLASEPRAMEAEFFENDVIRLVTWDARYELQHEVVLNELGAVAEDNDTISLCVGFESTESRVMENADAGSNISVASVTMRTTPYIATGIVNVSAECWARTRDMRSCDPVFIPMQEVIEGTVYAHSPLQEMFWILLNDENVTEKWVKQLSIDSINRTFPSSWVAHLQLNSLELLKIKGNNWGRPQTLLSPLAALQRLDLTFNNIQELPTDTFNNTPSLRDIVLARNNLSVFPSSLGKLVRLSLLDITNPEGRAKLVVTTEDILDLHRVNILGLENINLSANITALLDLPNLSFLNLSGCGIDKIDDITFEAKKKQLDQLDLSKNNLSKLPPKLFSTLERIRSLYLQHNYFESCPPYIENLPFLSRLDLSYNKIWRLTTLCFDKPHNNLKNLDLSHNQISFIMDGVFQNLRSLRILKLSNNKLSTVQPTLFQGVSYLKLLDLSNNQLTSDIQFKNIVIQDISVSNNRLVNLPNVSDFNTELLAIDASMNNITRLLVPSPHTKKLNLSYNGITKLSKEMRGALDSFIEVVDLGGNFFNCCEDNLNEIKQWLKETHVDIQNLGTKLVLKCRIPGENQWYPMRTFLDEEGLCHGQSTSSRTYGSKDTSVLYGVVGFLTVLVLVLSVSLGYIMYKQRHNVLTWFKFTES